MQIDFHHAVTYVTARIAGFLASDASTIAYAAQYVDDATNSGTIVFSNGALYTRISSAHKSIDPLNLSAVEDRLVWAPFHFLPGGDPEVETDKYVSKLVCAPNSKIAQQMLDAAFAGKTKKNKLHRLGIALHVYADTWAHQGFAGIVDDLNIVRNAQDLGNSGVFNGVLQEFLNRVIERAAPPIGHGQANVFPDMPFLHWQYENGYGETIIRDNKDEFYKAADAMCKTMQKYLEKPETGIGQDDAATIKNLFLNTKEQDGLKRHQKWVECISAGAFSFGREIISYDADGSNSWKAQILGTTRDLPRYPYNDDFLNSNWKKFHDALQEHRLVVLHDILPQYGICIG